MNSAMFAQTWMPGPTIVVALTLWFTAFLASLTGLWRVFVKAGEPGWAALVPFYNAILLARTAGQSVWWGVLLHVPVINLIATIQIALGLAQKFGKTPGFAVGLILLAPVFLPILGFGSATYRPAPTRETPVILDVAVADSSDAPDVATHFGRVRWWFEESPMAFTASVAMALVTIGFFYILTVRALHADSPLASIALQPVQAESLAAESVQPAEQTMEIRQLAAGSPEMTEEINEKPELPELPRETNTLKPLELFGNQADSDKPFQETEAAIREANEALRKILEQNMNRGTGNTGAGEGRGVGQLDPNSTPGRMARWIITYPTVPQSEYERMLDFFRIELAYLMADRKTMQYVSNLATTGKKRTGDADREDRMFWYWMGQNRLRELDEAITRKHGLEPTSEVVQLFTKELEHRLSELEQEYLRRHFKTSDVERIAQTNFRIAGGPAGWRMEVTGISLR